MKTHILMAALLGTVFASGTSYAQTPAPMPARPAPAAAPAAPQVNPQKVSERIDEVRRIFADRPEEVVRGLIEQRTRALAIEEELQVLKAELDRIRNSGDRREQEMRIRQIELNAELEAIKNRVAVRKEELALQQLEADRERMTLDMETARAKAQAEREKIEFEKRERERLAEEARLRREREAQAAAQTPTTPAPSVEPVAPPTAELPPLQEFVLTRISGVGNSLVAQLGSPSGIVYTVQTGDRVGSGEVVVRISGQFVDLRAEDGSERRIFLARVGRQTNR